MTFFLMALNIIWKLFLLMVWLYNIWFHMKSLLIQPQHVNIFFWFNLPPPQPPHSSHMLYLSNMYSLIHRIPQSTLRITPINPNGLVNTCQVLSTSDKRNTPSKWQFPMNYIPTIYSFGLFHNAPHHPEVGDPESELNVPPPDIWAVLADVTQLAKAVRRNLVQMIMAKSNYAAYAKSLGWSSASKC